MITDQWLCPCGFGNSVLRETCRNCGELKLPDEKTESPSDIMQRLNAGRHDGPEELPRCKCVEPPYFISLTLEESSWLCHYIMGEIGPYITGEKKFTDASFIPVEVQQRVFERKLALYEKLSAVNDRLMGKVPDDKDGTPQ